MSNKMFLSADEAVEVSGVRRTKFNDLTKRGLIRVIWADGRRLFDPEWLREDIRALPGQRPPSRII